MQNRCGAWVLECKFFIVLAWLLERELGEDFEELEDQQLADTLLRFYGEVRDKEGKRYSQNSLRAIRAAINRHIKGAPFNRSIDIALDRQFIQANQVFTGYIKANIREGNAEVKHKVPINDEDWGKLLNSKELDVNTPSGLQNKVFVNIMTQFGRRGCEGLRNLTKKSFRVKKDEFGSEYIERAHDEISKNFQGENSKEHEKCGVMHRQFGDPKCPVHSFKLYLSKLAGNSDVLFTYPKNKWVSSDGTWYTAKPMGHNAISKWMTKLSKAAGLSQIYSNHCLRATVATRLSRAGVPDREIINVTGHKNEQSLKHYVTAQTACQKRKLSTIIHECGEAKDKSPIKKRVKSDDIEIKDNVVPSAPITEELDDDEFGLQGLTQATLRPDVEDLADEEFELGDLPANADTEDKVEIVAHDAQYFTGAVFNNVTINIFQTKQ